FSTFDLLHAGHVSMLQQAKSVCDYLIACLQIDPTIDREHINKPVQSLIEREIQLRSCKYVDEIIVYQTEMDVIDILRLVRPDIRILGEEYKDVNFTGREYCISNGIELYYNKRDHIYSSSELRYRIFQLDDSLEER